MRRPIALILTVLAVLALPTSVAAGPRADSPLRQRASGVFAQFKLKANNGLSAQLVTTGNTVDLEISGHNQFAVYRVKGTVSERGVSARFGNLGRISVRFQPAGTAGQVRKGVFVGTIEFTGERDYVRVDATRAKGSMLRTTRHRDGVGARSSRVGEEPRKATLSAKAGDRLFRAAVVVEPNGRGVSVFSGGLRERQGAMLIGRGALVKGTPTAFLFDHASGTATVQPPLPFSGSASLATRPDGSKGWEGTLSVPLLGADPVTLAGPEFQAELLREFDD
jgi:hypothetical protein